MKTPKTIIITLLAATAVLTGLAVLCLLTKSCVNRNKWEKSHRYKVPPNLSREHIEGYYVDIDSDGAITLWITNTDEGYTYEMNTGKRLLSGTVGFPDDEKYISLNGMENVQVYIGEKGLTIQNTVFHDIDRKYITLIKSIAIE